ncbi:T9SS-dependent M36 family metallopeptidase [Chryseobacterium wangxinyae]|uniref:T9SS-dependent M36 family metallopeptidase n=1 Tax=Chryseobacterium sp. CY353 TaxID=2997334 RepID=UPI00226DEFC8|nr:T9SS-dependent M36 family metallopeptidase [Chryseobacterium sp. CY353]MCY0968032.1 T9SS-dependent M36 family metallopeptidase [Chryseobacterium sp. CY353]
MKKVILPLLFAIFIILPSSNLFSQENQKLIKDYITAKQLRDYKKSDLAGFVIDNVDVSNSLKGNVVKFQQTYKGYPVYNSVGTALVKENKIVYYSDSFVKDYTQSANNTASITSYVALKKISDELNKDEISNFIILDSSAKEPDHKKYAKQRLVYVEDQGVLRFVYEFTLREPKSPNLWNILVDANSGEIIRKENLNLSCSFHPGAFGHDHSSDNFVGPLNNVSSKSSLLLPDNSSYNVFALPLEAPTFGSRSVITNPWLPSSSPQGWHFDGTDHYTITRGNNVYAYEDIADIDAPGYSPDGGTARDFNFPFSLAGDPYNNLDASITNLFYLNNRIHDIFYKFGFTESARNFQQSNFGNGGLGNDYVEAEGLDGGGINNANFGTPSDGNKPYMQMYLWSPENRNFFYNAPSAAVSREPVVAKAEFGPALTATGVTANIQLANVITGCTALTAGSLNGKIGLIERGGSSSCTFNVKVKNAQNAGAVAAIVYNNVTATNFPSVMGGVDGTITIPSVLISNAEGEYIKGQLSANTVINVTLKDDPATMITPDGSFDNGIVTHEYGHGISTRLTGNGSTCLQTSQSREQMGEGWSDFFALMLTNKPGDNASVARGMGTYANGQAITGGGIRPAKYSPNFSINAFTYGDTNVMQYNNGSALVPDVHSIGFVWATMLWDLNWDYVAKYGYSSDVTTSTTSGSSRILQLVTDALKIQICNPTFIDGRNAILTAELNTTAGADRCMIWRAFAKRGLGFNASAGLKTSITDQVEDYTVPADCVLSTNETASVKDNAISIYPNPAKNEFFISFPKNTLGKVNVEIYDMSGKLVSTESKISPDAKKAISTSSLTNGTYLVKVNGIGINAASKVIINK